MHQYLLTDEHSNFVSVYKCNKMCHSDQ